MCHEGRVRQQARTRRTQRAQREVSVPAFLVLSLPILVTMNPGSPCSLAGVEEKIPFPIDLGLGAGGGGICRGC